MCVPRLLGLCTSTVGFDFNKNRRRVVRSRRSLQPLVLLGPDFTAAVISRDRRSAVIDIVMIQRRPVRIVAAGDA